MAKKYKKKAVENSTTKEVFESLDQSVIESELFLEKNAKLISIIFGVLLAIALAYFAYVNLYQEPQNQVATKDLYNAKVELDKDSLSFALDGQSGGYIGFNEIKEKYSNTNAGNLAHYYAAIANYKQGEYSKAFDNLNEFDANDEVLAAMKIGIQGDCLVQIAEYEKALEYYQNAANTRDNEFTTPMYLLKAGKLALTLEKKEQALKFFTQIKEQYEESSYASDIDKYIARAK